MAGRTALRCLLAAGTPLLVVAEQKEFHKVDIAISVMLLGSIGFQMGLFYILNHPDDDIKRYSWTVVGSTISIFCAVLLFQAFQAYVNTYLLDGYCIWTQFVVNLV